MTVYITCFELHNKRSSIYDNKGSNQNL